VVQAPIRVGTADPQHSGGFDPLHRDANRQGAQIARSAGTSATLLAREGTYAQVRMRSGEVRKITSNAAPPLVKLPMKSTACVASAKPV
jgi:hypothetical protein